MEHLLRCFTKKLKTVAMCLFSLQRNSYCEFKQNLQIVAVALSCVQHYIAAKTNTCLAYYSKCLEVRVHCNADSMKSCLLCYTFPGQGKNNSGV